MPTASTPLFRRVLCPVDFSGHARTALRYAAALARRSGGALGVLFVNDPLLVAAAAAAYNRQSLGAASRGELERFVATTLGARGTRGLTIRYETALGPPAREILKAAQAGRYDSLVVGTKGLNGARRLFFGSTTSALLRKTMVPILAVPMGGGGDRGEPVPRSWPGRRVLVPVALDPHAEEDARRAARVANWVGASLVLVHVVAASPAPTWFGGDVRAELEQQATRASDRLAAVGARLGVPASTKVEAGYPPEVIAAVARRLRAGLVVMALRGGEGVLGAPVGSIAYNVLCEGIAPVLALPPTRR